MTLTVADWAEAECKRLEREWKAGDYRAAAECFDVCAPNGQPLPDWLVPVIRQAMAFAAHRINRDGKVVTNAGSYATAWTRLDIRRRRHSAAARALRMRDTGELAVMLGKDKVTKRDAYKWAAEQLRGTPAYGDEARVRRAYGEVERAQNVSQLAAL